MSPTATSNRRKSSGAVSMGSGKMDATRKRIERMELEREERRKSMLQRKEARKQEQLKNIAAGNPGDVDFIGMVEEWRRQQSEKPRLKAKSKGSASNICIAVRKRPMSEKEIEKLDHDSVSCFPPQVTIHSAKLKVDGITKYLTHNSFQFDHAFGDGSTTEQIYVSTTLPLVDHVVSTQGRATVFCYGQTGSGKTYTMNGIQQILAYDLYGQIAENRKDDLEIAVAFFELYGGYIQDLLHQRKRCKLLEDGQGEVNITGLHEVPAPTPEDFLRIIEEGHSLRTTHTTEANDSSSRSHAICQVFLRDRSTGKLKGKLGLVDLAGSERGSDTKSHNTQRRAESADINTSLLSLKECIRALGQKSSSHVPYRGSKLTLILKDCFSPDSRTTMIATVSPGASSTDHSLNTLRYADRIKEQRTTPSSTGRKSMSSRSTSSRQSRQPQEQKILPPSKERLARIAASSSLTHEHRQDTTDDVAEVDDQWSPTGSQQEESHFYFEGGDIEEDDTPPVVDTNAHRQEDEENMYEDISEPTNSEDDSPSLADEQQSPETAPIEKNATLEDEAEMRRIVQGLFELEEALLNQHMSNIQENAEMLTQEGKVLQRVQAGGHSEEELDEYAIQLAEFLDRKEALIQKLNSRLTEFQAQLVKEQQLAQRVTKLTQY